MAVAVVLVVLGAVPVGSPGTAYAQSEQDCWEWRRIITGENEDGDPVFGWRLVNTCETGSEGGSGGGGQSACVHSDLGEFPCYDPVRGWWSSSLECYLSLASPQPPPGDEAWEGNSSEDGAVYLSHCPQPDGAWSVGPVFLAQQPGFPSIAEMAQQAMDSLPLVPADIGIAPDPDGVGLVGVPVWLWTNDTSATWGPVQRRVPGPGFDVVAEGTAIEIEWDMGDGNTVVCDGPGVPYQPSFGLDDPECGHVYDDPSLSRPGDRYQITATTTWEVEWWVEGNGSDEGGFELFFRESSTSAEIHELQVVTS